MGAIFSSIFQRLWGTKEVRILILGIDGAGKTTILYRLQIGEVVTTIPTIGFNVETVTYKNIKFQVWDLGGQTSIRPYWRCYYQNTDAVIYVIDSSDRARLGISKDELHAMLAEEELRGAKLMVLANKQDLKNAMDAAEVSDALGLTDLRGRQWAIFRCSAITGEGLTEGLDWLATQVNGGTGSNGTAGVGVGAAAAVATNLSPVAKPVNSSATNTSSSLSASTAPPAAPMEPVK